MNIDTKELIELQADQPMPSGFEMLPEDLQGDAARLLTWAEQRQQQRRKKKKEQAKRKAKRKAARKARKRNRR